MSQETYTIRQIVDLEREAGRKCSKPTVQAWINQGRFPNAYQDQQLMGVWKVPVTDYEMFQRPKRGAPPKAARNG